MASGGTGTIRKETYRKNEELSDSGDEESKKKKYKEDKLYFEKSNLTRRTPNKSNDTNEEMIKMMREVMWKNDEMMAEIRTIRKDQKETMEYIKELKEKNEKLEEGLKMANNRIEQLEKIDGEII